MTVYILIDAVLIGLLSIFALKGMKMGLVLAVASAITLVIAMFGARFITETYSGHVAGLFEPMVNAWVENKAGLEIDTSTIAAPDFSLAELLRSLGLSEKLAGDIAAGVSAQIAKTGESIGQAVSGSLSLVVARFFTYTVSFCAIALLLYVAARLFDTVAKLPILNLLNKLGGLAGGAAAGGVIMYIVIDVVNFLGLIGPNAYNQTYVLKMFITFMEERL
jgi:hypothetical protein